MSKPGEKKKRGNFFGIDRRTWARLCDVATINEAVAYIVLAQGTGADNRSTSWSATALKKYAGIGWDRGTLAIQGLLQKAFLRCAETSTRNKPRYDLPQYGEIAQAAFD